MKKLFTLVLLVLATTVTSFAGNIVVQENEEGAADQTTAQITENMKYKQLKNIYNYKNFTPTVNDRYSPGWSAVASFFIPGLGQMICGEVGRGFAYFGGAAGCYLVAGVGSALSMNGNQTAGLTVSIAGLAGVLAVEVLAIIDADRVARVKNMYEQDLRKKLAFDIDLYPSVDFIQSANGLTPTAGMTLALKF